MKKMFLMLFTVALFSVGFTSCRDTNDANDDVEDVADDIGDEIEDTADDVGDGIDEAADEVDEEI